MKACRTPRSRARRWRPPPEATRRTREPGSTTTSPTSSDVMRARESLVSRHRVAHGERCALLDRPVAHHRRAREAGDRPRGGCRACRVVVRRGDVRRRRARRCAPPEGHGEQQRRRERERRYQQPPATSTRGKCRDPRRRRHRSQGTQQAFQRFDLRIRRPRTVPEIVVTHGSSTPASLEAASFRDAGSPAPRPASARSARRSRLRSFPPRAA